MIIIDKLPRWRLNNKIALICRRNCNYINELSEKEVNVVELKRGSHFYDSNFYEIIKILESEKIIKIRKERYRCYYSLTKKGLMIKEQIKIIFESIGKTWGNRQDVERKYPD